jgi:hypothetical protein
MIIFNFQSGIKRKNLRVHVAGCSLLESIYSRRHSWALLLTQLQQGQQRQQVDVAPSPPPPAFSMVLSRLSEEVESLTSRIIERYLKLHLKFKSWYLRFPKSEPKFLLPTSQ